jgi:hypothetical protein
MFKDLLDRIKEEFRHHPLGATYYLFMIISAVIVPAGFFLAWMQDPVKMGYLSVGLSVGGWILALTLLFFVVRSRFPRRPSVLALNPTVISLETTFELEVRRTARKVIRRDKLKAISSTKNFTYRFIPSGSISMAARLLSPGTAKFAGPRYDRNQVLFQATFDKPLEKNQIVDIAIEYTVDDPGATMKPYTALVAANLISFNRLVQHLKFPEDKPDSVEFEVTDTKTGTAMEPRRSGLYLNPAGDYIWEVNGVLSSNTYWVFWRW